MNTWPGSGRKTWRDSFYGVTRSQREGKSPSHEFVAPSWSWAAVNGLVERANTRRYIENAFENLIEIMSSSTELSSSGEFGAAKGGYIHLKGCLAAIQLVDNERHDVESILPTQIVKQGLSEFHVSWDAEGNWLNKGASDGKFSGMRALFFQFRTMFLIEVYGLILVPAEMLGVYRRVGYFNVADPDMKMKVAFACRYSYSLAKDRGLPYERTEDGMFRYTITLI